MIQVNSILFTLVYSYWTHKIVRRIHKIFHDIAIWVVGCDLRWNREFSKFEVIYWGADIDCLGGLDIWCIHYIGCTNIIEIRIQIISWTIDKGESDSESVISFRFPRIILEVNVQNILPIAAWIEWHCEWTRWLANYVARSRICMKIIFVKI